MESEQIIRPMLRLKASDPGYEEINRLWNLYAIAVNPHVWANHVDMTDDDMIVLRSDLTEYMEMALETPPAFTASLANINLRSE